VSNQQTTNNVEEKLDVLSQFEKGEQIVDICCNFRLAHSHTIHDNTDRIKESVKSGTEVFVCVAGSPIAVNCTKNHAREPLTFLLH
jgi:hypothetical protein